MEFFTPAKMQDPKFFCLAQRILQFQSFWSLLSETLIALLEVDLLRMRRTQLFR